MGSHQNIVLAIDMGTSGPKVCLVDGSGKVLGHSFAPTELILLPGGGQEQRPGDWWAAIDRATRELLACDLVPRAAIRSISVTTQWSGTVALGADGEPLMNAIGWMDTRGAPHIAEICRGWPRIEGYGLRRALRWIQLTGGAPGHSGKDSLAHILWIKHSAPRVYEKTTKFLEPKDWVNFKLTGRHAAGYDSIALHWVTDNRKVDAVRYHPQLLEWTGLDLEKLPELRAPGEILGPIRAEIAEAWGLERSVEVAIGTPDVHAAAVGSGGVGDFEPHLYLGTSSWICAHVDFKKTDVVNSLATLPAGMPGRYLIMNEQESAGACLNWLRDQIFLADDGLTERPDRRGAYARLDALAERSPPGAKGLLFAPWLVGERTPIEDPHVRGAWFNLSLSHARADLVRAVLEGVALNSRWLLASLERFAKRRVESLRVIGGGARSALWCQIYADVLERPILQMSQPLEAGARGAACLSLVARGELDWSSFARGVEVERTFEPRPEFASRYADLYGELRALYRRNRSAFRRMNGRTN